MKDKVIMALFCIFLIVSSSVNVYALDSDDEDNLGEIVLINVANPEKLRISSDYVRNKKFPVYVDLTGTTLESFLFGSDNPAELTTTFGGLGIDHIFIERDSVSKYVAGIDEIAPEGGYFINPDGSVDLGSVKITLRKIPKEEDLPDRIDMNFTARVYFDTESSFSVFGKQDLFLELDKVEDPDGEGVSVWDGRARIDFLDLKGDNAYFQVYDGANRKLGGTFSLKVGQVKTMRLNDGPAFLDNQVRFQLKGIYGSEKKAVINIFRNGESRSVTLVEDMNLYAGSDWVVEDIVKDGVELRNTLTREKIKLEVAETGEYKTDVCDNVERLQVDDNKVYLEGFGFLEGEDFSEENNLPPLKNMLKEESLSFYCSAIDQYENALTYAVGEDAAELKFKIAKIYYSLEDMDNALRYYSSISSGSDVYSDNDVSSIINDLNNLNENGVTNFEVLEDNTRIYLESVDPSGESSSYFEYKEIRDGQKLDEREAELGDKIITGSGGSWYVDRIKPDEIELIKLDENDKKIDEKDDIDLGTNILEKDLSIEITNIETPYSVVVSAIPGDGRNYGLSHFTVRIPVEKSAIQWTPEQIDDMIEKTHKAVEDLENIMDKLGNFIKGMKAACFGIYAVLAIKNSFFRDGGARKQVIDERAVFCKETDNYGDEYDNFEDCINYYADEDEENIKKLTAIRKESDELFGNFGDTLTEDDFKTIAREMNVDEEQLASLMKYSDFTGVSASEAKRLLELSEYDPEKFSEDWEGYSDKIARVDLLSEKVGGRELSKEEIRAIAVPIFDDRKKAKNFEDNQQSTEDKVKAKYGQNVEVHEAGYTTANRDEIFSADIEGNLIELEPMKENLDTVQIDGFSVYLGSDGDYYLTKGAADKIFGEEYASGERNKLEINEDGKLWIFPFETTTKSPIYEKLDYANYVVVNYESSTSIESYSVYNVGPNGEVDYPSAGDDQLIVPYLLPVDDTRRTVDEKDSNNILRIVSEIDSKYDDLTKKRLTAGKGVTYNEIPYTVSNAASRAIGETEGQCTNYMSKGDCNLLYNFCDPVMCPASRFDLNNRWDVDNVVQTGIIGSLVLGMPNWIALGGSNIFPPICLTGIHAGLDNIRSKFEGFEDCLQKAKTEGEDVGICNTIKSIYMCEILWREGLAIFGSLGKLADIISERVFGIFGFDGWEYGKWQSSWNDLRDNVDYFTSEYARSAFASYQARSASDFGTEVCQAAIYGNVPGGGDFIGELLEPDSPYQFTGWFDEMEYAEEDEGKSIYRIYYHIYAGRDEDIEYLVYLKGTGLNNLYVTNPERGYRREVLNEGEYADRSYTITGDSGYNVMCIYINGQEYCGFGKVSSAFSSKYLQDMMLEDELTRSDIKSADDCMSDTSGGQLGVIRICSLTDPDGLGARWVEIEGSSCGEDEAGNSLGTCYLDYENSADFNDLKKKDEIAEAYFGEDSEEAEEAVAEATSYLNEFDTRVDQLIEKNKAGYNLAVVEELLAYPSVYLDSIDAVKLSEVYIRGLDKVGDIYSALGDVLKAKESSDEEDEGEDDDVGDFYPSSFDYIKLVVMRPNPKADFTYEWDSEEWELLGAGGRTFDASEEDSGLREVYSSISNYIDEEDSTLLFDEYEGKRYGRFPLNYFNSYNVFKNTILNLKDLDLEEYLDYSGSCNSISIPNSDWLSIDVFIDNANDPDYKFENGEWKRSMGFDFGEDLEAGLSDIYDGAVSADGKGSLFGTYHTDAIKFTYSLSGNEKVRVVPFYLIDNFDDVKKIICFLMGRDDSNEPPFYELLAQTEELIGEEGLTIETQESLNALYDSGKDLFCSDGNVAEELEEFSESLEDNEFIGPLEVEEIQEDIYDVLGTSCDLDEIDEIPFYELLAQTEELIEEEGLTSETQESLDALYGSAVDAICLEDFPQNMVCDLEDEQVCLDEFTDDIFGELFDFSQFVEDSIMVSSSEAEEIQEDIGDVLATSCDLNEVNESPNYLKIQIDMVGGIADQMAYWDNNQWDIDFLNEDDERDLSFDMGLSLVYEYINEYEGSWLDNFNQIKIKGDYGIEKDIAKSSFFEMDYSQFKSWILNWEENVVQDDFNDLVWQIRNGGINNGVRDKECNCGSKADCDEMADYIQEYSGQYGINPNLAFALVIQESECKVDAVSGSGAYGLWQVTRTTFNDKCSNDFDSFEDVQENVENNIACGAKIFKAKYNEFSSGVYNSWSYENVPDFVEIVDNCVESYPKYENYRGWEAALRGYNGWGCGSGSDVGYVEKITTMFDTLETGLPLEEVAGDYVDCTLFDEDLARCRSEIYCFVKENPFWEIWNEYDCVSCFDADCDDIKDDSKCSGDCGSVAGCEWSNSECVDS